MDTYDPLGRLSSEQQADGTGVVQSTVTYAYDADGNKLSQITISDGDTASMTGKAGKEVYLATGSPVA